MDAINILITNAGNILRFLKEFAVDGAKDVSITYINADSSESVKTFPNIAKMVASYNITNSDGVIRDLDGNLIRKTDGYYEINNGRVHQKRFPAYCDGGSTISLGTISGTSGLMMCTVTVAWTSLYSYTDETAHGHGVWTASFRQNNDDPNTTHSLDKNEVSTIGNHAPDNLYFDGKEIKFATTIYTNAVLDVSITIADGTIN